MSNQEDLREDSQEESAVSGRRDFLKKAGKFAIYTPPAVMLMVKPSYATFNKSFVGRPKKRRNNKRRIVKNYKKYNKRWW